MSEMSIFFSGPENFATIQRVAQALSKSNMVPVSYQNNIPNTLVALEIADRLKMSPLMVMQNLNVIHGKPSWSSKSLIAMFNQCGKFGPIDYEFTGEKGKPTYGCIAFTTDIKSGKRIEGPEVTMDIASKEGWLNKKGSKWQTMPDLMLRYRAGSWLVNTVAPDISFGFSTTEEVQDFSEMKDITPTKEDQSEPITATQSDTEKKTRIEAIIEAEAEPVVQESVKEVEGDLI